MVTDSEKKPNGQQELPATGPRDFIPSEVKTEPKEDPDAEEAEKPGESPVERASRQQRRAERYSNYKELTSRSSKLESELAEARKNLDADRAERERMARELAEMRGRFAERESRQEPKKDTLDDELADLNERARKAYAAEDWQDARRYEREIAEKIAERRADVRVQEALKQFKQPDPTQIILTAEFPWLPSNENARRVADGYINILIGQGRADNLETYREACKRAAADMKLSGAAAPLPQSSPAQRQLYGGIPSREIASSGNDGPREASEMEQRLANAAGVPIEALMRTRARNSK